MKTDVPLKRLTRLCPGDLLSLLGEADATVLGVETLELPTSKTSLDSVLHLRTPQGQEYLHLVEWQGWTDPLLLWRTLSYLGWLGQHRAERPILVTVIYLKPGDDVGDTLDQRLAGVAGWLVRLPCVRLWQQDAAAALASGAPGLLTLAPLMQGATPALVEDAAQTLIRTTAPPVQGELLAALGIFAEPLLAAERFIRLVTKERLMTTDLISYLLQDKVEEFAQEKAVLEQEKAALEQEKVALAEQLRTVLQHAIEDVIALRFPSAPVTLTHKLRTIGAIDTLQALHRAVLAAPDLAAVEQLISAARPDPAA